VSRVVSPREVEVSRRRAISRRCLHVAIAALAVASAGLLRSSLPTAGATPVVSLDAGGHAQSSAASLAQYLNQYYGTLSSPIYRAGTLTWDLTVVTPTKSFVGQFQVLVDERSRWTMVQRLPDPSVTQHPPSSQWSMARGHYLDTVPSTKDPIIYFQSLGLGPGVPAVALFYSGVAGWTALVVARIEGRWKFAPFTKYGTGELPDPVFGHDGIVQTSTNDCSPSCADGHLTIRKFRFSSKLGLFDQFYVGGAGRPGSPDG
jgi:hypothetical protein